MDEGSAAAGSVTFLDWIPTGASHQCIVLAGRISFSKDLHRTPTPEPNDIAPAAAVTGPSMSVEGSRKPILCVHRANISRGRQKLNDYPGHVWVPERWTIHFSLRGFRPEAHHCLTLVATALPRRVGSSARPRNSSTCKFLAPTAVSCFPGPCPHFARTSFFSGCWAHCA